MDSIIASVPVLAAKRDALLSVDGMGDISTRLILALMPELGQFNRKSVAAMAGLAPFNRSSGETLKQSSIRGGRFLLRKSLFMPALCARGKNQVLKAYYDRLRARGKPYRVIHVAIMRKLIVYLNELARKVEEAHGILSTRLGCIAKTGAG